MKDFQGSFEASEYGIAKAYKAGVRESIGEGQLRRAIALTSLGRYADAAYSIGIADKYTGESSSNKKSIPIWKMKIESHLKQLDEEDLDVSIQEIPDIPEEDEKVFVSKDAEPEIPKTASAPIEYPDPATVRYDWFQMGDKCDLSIFIKNAPKDSVTVDFTESSATVKFPIADSEQSYTYSIGPFANVIVPSSSTFKVFGTKIELTLAKITKSAWTTLLSPESESTINKRAPISLEEVRKNFGTNKDDGHSAPVPAFEKNWEKMASEALGDDGKEENPDDFFKELYKNADDNTKKAMLKSYTESGGTTLSTNWEDVKKAPVPISPPTGMEAKKY